MKISGIYKIINKVNGKYYVGSSNDVHGRWYRHKSQLNHNKHNNPHLQLAWNKYGIENFHFSIEERILEKNLLLVEQHYLNICKECPNTNYNISYDAMAPMTGKHHSKKTRNLLRIKSTGRFHSEESKIKQSKAMKGRYSGENNPMFGKNRKGNNNPMFGRKHSNKSKEQSRLAHLGRYVGVLNPNYGKSPTENTRKKMSDAQRDRTIYTFKNTITQDVFSGTRQDFSVKFGIPKSTLQSIVRYHKIRKGWVLDQWNGNILSQLT